MFTYITAYMVYFLIFYFLYIFLLELINYFPCVTLACILLSLQIDAQGLHINLQHINMADDVATWIHM